MSTPLAEAILAAYNESPSPELGRMLDRLYRADELWHVAVTARAEALRTALATVEALTTDDTTAPGVSLAADALRALLAGKDTP